MDTLYGNLKPCDFYVDSRTDKGHFIVDCTSLGGGPPPTVAVSRVDVDDVFSPTPGGLHQRASTGDAGLLFTSWALTSVSIEIATTRLKSGLRFPVGTTTFLQQAANQQPLRSQLIAVPPVPVISKPTLMKDVREFDFFAGKYNGLYVTRAPVRMGVDIELWYVTVVNLDAGKSPTVGKETANRALPDNEFLRSGWPLSVMTMDVVKALAARGLPLPGGVSPWPNIAAGQGSGKHTWIMLPDIGNASPSSAKPRIEANAEVGRTTCSKCGGKMKELFTSRYCPTCE
jgi:hypothetical protein